MGVKSDRDGRFSIGGTEGKGQAVGGSWRSGGTVHADGVDARGGLSRDRLNGVSGNPEPSRWPDAMAENTLSSQAASSTCIVRRFPSAAKAASI
jgi:hypothetical protein